MFLHFWPDFLGHGWPNTRRVKG